MRFHLIVLSIVIMMPGCDPVDDKLQITNQSNSKIYYMRSHHSSLSSFYQETLSRQTIETTHLNYIQEIEPNTTKRELITGSNNAWERYVKEACEGGKLRIYTFDLDTLTKYNFREVIDKNLYLVKMEFSVNDLEELNWEIVIR